MSRVWGVLEINTGASIFTNTILGVPYYTYSIMGPKTLIKLLRPRYEGLGILCSALLWGLCFEGGGGGAGREGVG